jgi:hypothetical protein
MRDGTKATAAFLQSELYRGARRGVEARPAGKAGAPPRARGRGGKAAPSRSPTSGPASTLSLLALLGLLDVFGEG